MSDEQEQLQLRAELARMERKIKRLQLALDELETITERRTLELYQANSVLGRFLAPQVRQILEQGTEARLQAKKSYITIIFGDLKGFTDLAEVMDAEEMTSIINDYFDMVLRLISENGGVLDKFIGDGFMAFWGAPESLGRQEDAKNCARFALSLQSEFEKLAEVWIKNGLDHHLSLRQGIHSGYCTVGNFGSSSRLQYTAMGNPVNLASRLESLASPGSILASHSTSMMISNLIPIKEAGKVQVKGIKHPVTTYTLGRIPVPVRTPDEMNMLSDLLKQMENFGIISASEKM